MNDYTLEHGNQVLRNVHKVEDCTPPCAIHSKTNHRMRDWPQYWRSDRFIIERICIHGVGHPDPDSGWPEGDSRWSHGCDGCCTGLVFY